MHPPPSSSAPTSTTPKYLRRAAWACLAVTAATSGLIHLFMARPKASDVLITPANQRSYEFAMERIGGKSVIFAARFNDWLDSLWQADRLPYTVLVLGMLMAGVCFGLAHLLSIPLDDEPPPR